MTPRDAFEICHEVYGASRALVDGRVATTQMTSASKFLWRPDIHPRLVEYVADFARAGERALGGDDERAGRGCEAARRDAAEGFLGQREGGSARNDSRPVGAARTQPSRADTRRDAPRRGLRASRLILFRMYYLGGAEYHAARMTLGISERTWADWADEIRELVGRELLRSGMCPPSAYFRESTAQCVDDERTPIARAS
jgi:hypothetical protein